ncbi:hypothetical protein DL769_001912 [Monosporascus sp. CRB-8-3]|nr:hypothetical protein DL769_001912 [Monosporascus sp. CRB-8-3]
MDTSKDINKTGDLAETKKPSPTFPRFGRLPRELRHMIWREAVKSPQYIYVDFSSFDSADNPQPPVIVDGERREQIPPLLMVNRESRSVALKLYDVSFHIARDGDLRYFIMSEYDTLVAKGCYAELCRAEFGGGDASRIRNVMVSASLFHDSHIKEFCKRGPRPIWPLRDRELHLLQSFGCDLVISARKLVSKVGNVEALESVTVAIRPRTHYGDPQPHYRSLEPARFHTDYKNKKDDEGQKTTST